MNTSLPPLTTSSFEFGTIAKALTPSNPSKHTQRRFMVSIGIEQSVRPFLHALSTKQSSFGISQGKTMSLNESFEPSFLCGELVIRHLVGVYSLCPSEEIMISICMIGDWVKNHREMDSSNLFIRLTATMIKSKNFCGDVVEILNMVLMTVIFN